MEEFDANKAPTEEVFCIWTRPGEERVKNETCKIIGGCGGCLIKKTKPVEFDTEHVINHAHSFTSPD